MNSAAVTDEQKAKVKEITEAGRAAIQPLIEQERASHEQNRTLGSDGKFDQAQVEALATEHGSVAAKLFIERQKVKAQIYALLSDEQKAKAAEFRAKGDGRGRAGRFGDRNSGSEL